MSPQLKAVLQALLVTFLWSTSWVLIKIGLDEIPSLTFSGLRYSLAFVCLLPFFLRAGGRRTLAGFSSRTWLRLGLLGVLFYSLTQGAQFVGLDFLPAVTVNLLLSLTSVAVALLGIFLLAEVPARMQWIGIFFSILGALVFFYPAAFEGGQLVGIVVVLVGVLANAGSSLLGRSINRQGDLSPLTVTVVSMGIGGTLTLALGWVLQGLPTLSLGSWLIVLWLAVVNTAFAFTLWNLTLRTLSAMESSIINNTMMIQIPILAVIFLGESLNGQQILGLALAVLGVVLVNLRVSAPRRRLRDRQRISTSGEEEEIPVEEA